MSNDHLMQSKAFLEHSCNCSFIDTAEEIYLQGALFPI